MWSYITKQYEYYITSQADPRIKGYPLMDSPQPAIILCLLYLIFVQIVGPAIMKNRKPLEINKIIIVYNALQTLFSLTMFTQGLYFQLQIHNLLGCNPHVFRTDPLALKAVHISWIFLTARFFEFFDTIFFILRKKDNQVTKLHVFHHFVVPLICWVGVKIVPGSQYTYAGIINAFVHTFMYLYYMLTAMGPEYKKYLWWKKYMTVLQLAQFILVIVHTILTLVSGCAISQVFGYLILLQAATFLILFWNFYRQTYNYKKVKSEPLFGMDNIYQICKAFFDMCIPNQHILYKEVTNTQEDQESTNILNIAEEKINEEKVNKTHLE